jgi:hypothetical protein
MRYRLGLTLAIVMILGLVGLGKAACRAAGNYRVTGPASWGFLTLKGGDEVRRVQFFREGRLDLYPRGGCPLGDFGGRILMGKYHSAPRWDRSCLLILRVFDPVSSHIGERGGTLAFRGP